MEKIKESDIITPKMLDDIKLQNANAKVIEGLIAKAKSAGLDVGDKEEGVRKAKQQLSKLRDAFFPGQQLDI